MNKPEDIRLTRRLAGERQAPMSGTRPFDLC